MLFLPGRGSSQGCHSTVLEKSGNEVQDRSEGDVNL